MSPLLRFLGLLLFASAGRQTIGQVRRQIEAQRHQLARRDVNPALLYPAHNFSTPIDHFHNETKYEPHSNGTYPMRYWYDASYYKPGGPVIVLQCGEGDASARLPILQKGILAQLIQATNGIGVVMEHRYYGTSFPTPDLSTESLRFLTTEQALADAAYFARHVEFAGLEKYGDLTSNTTAYIGYGGSYSGAFNAFLRVQYPDVFWGTISSSGVTKAIYDYWQYFDAIARYQSPLCVATQQTLTHIVDNILIGEDGSNHTNSGFVTQLKSAFGLPNVTYNNDFADVLTRGLGLQALNWDPSISNPEFYSYCANISNTSVLYPSTKAISTTVSDLISEAGYTANTSLVNQMLNYVGYINLTAVASCAASNETQDQCFGNHNSTFYQQDDVTQTWRSWPYQYCTQWGYLQTGSGVPANELPMVSRTIDLEYESIVCREAFGIHNPPNTNAINKYGGYNISYPRLAIVDGEWDPWRPATPHAFGYGAVDRPSTASQPFMLIAGAVHHWDENGVFPNQTTSTLPPLPVADTQRMELIFVKEWMHEWKATSFSS
ncbi:hypothetical protein BAUCODRAFT_125296 [Baudoinia panamericana UAMH 10762]|uniref:Uncharacterized protein n=1 Tax=Baudoinia panamericana (strain UAMH 10762) TaxID=717646 RepID=M2N411_BAUPA|nr:uncharacterized protein BAUCODRAFT_125296 [Baudoinia panamericana UAMH 10762]EMC93440.1 hypothetical protein BAUCODRAFT_125296 [Baudoinia panamericana UAMH 10762]